MRLVREWNGTLHTVNIDEDGLEQDFSSLHAQREACAAYVLSQASEGWTLLPGEYDDGGFSNGTLERPALQRLLADAAAGKVDIIVIYKIDRLTLNMPLSFAQFEREVTAERIRDKIAASSMKASTRASLPPLNGRLLAGIDSSALLNIRAIDPSREKQKRR